MSAVGALRPGQLRAPGLAGAPGWGAVAGSWFALFGGPQHLQFILTNESVEVTATSAG